MTNGNQFIPSGFDTAYYKRQEVILTNLLSQVGPGNSHARLQLQLRHTKNCIAQAAASRSTRA